MRSERGSQGERGNGEDDGGPEHDLHDTPCRETVATIPLPPEPPHLHQHLVPIAAEADGPVVDVDEGGGFVLADFVHFNAVARQPRGDGISPFQCAAAGGVDGDAVGFAEAGDGFFGAVDGWVGDNFDAAPAAAVGVEDTVEVEADRPPSLLNAVAGCQRLKKIVPLGTVTVPSAELTSD